MKAGEVAQQKEKQINYIHTHTITAGDAMQDLRRLTLQQLISFVYNNQLDASNIQNLFCHKILNVSGIFCNHHQELPTVRTAICAFHAGYVTTS